MRLEPDTAFIDTAGWTENTARRARSRIMSQGVLPTERAAEPPMLIVGEMDFSFSLAVAALRTTGSKLVATSYLEAFDMTEDQQIPEGDAERVTYERRSLPAMDGDLKANLKSLRDR
ncbi:unnamed protein product, partial [Prorocentrum cordatum]